MTPGRTQAKRGRPQLLAPAGLILLSFVPVLAGAARLTELAGTAAVTPQNERFFDSPVPVITHIVTVTIFCFLGALQFVPTLRRNSWHRVAGRILVPAGLLAALSGLWMTVFYPLPPGDGALVLAFRLVFGSAMVVGILIGMVAALRRRYVSHSEWMTRAYAIALGAGTQVLLLIPGGLIFGFAHELSRGILMGAAWVINLMVAEWIIRRRRAVRRGAPTTPRPAVFASPMASAS